MSFDRGLREKAVKAARECLDNTPDRFHPAAPVEEKNARQWAEAAERDKWFYDGIINTTARLLRENESIPKAYRDFVADVLQGKRNAPAKLLAFDDEVKTEQALYRAFRIYVTVGYIAKKFDLKKYDLASADITAAEIVAEAIGRDVETVRKAYQSCHRIFREIIKRQCG